MSFGLQQSRDLLALLAKLQSKVALSALHKQAWDKFLEIGLPQKKSENYQLFPLKALYEGLLAPPEDTQEQRATDLGCACIKLVFEEGRFSKERSDLDQLPPKALCLSFKEALQKFKPLVEHHLRELIHAETDPFALLNLALQEEALFFYLPPGCVVDRPIELVHNVKNPLSFARMHGVLGKGSSAILIQQGLPWNFFCDLVLEEEAALEQVDLTQGQWPFCFLRAVLKKAARLHHFRWATQALASRHDYRIQLREKESSAHLAGLSMLKNHAQSHVHVLMQHLAPATTSRQTFHAMQEDQSRSVFKGKIYVDALAQQTNAYQMSRSLLLGEHPVACSEPNLEIFADDVKASHGATVTQLQALELFYLKARGLSDPEAKQLLVAGFCQELMHHIAHADLRAELLKRVG